jgi:centractin
MTDAILDSGSLSLKAGLMNFESDYPSLIIKNVLGKSNLKNVYKFLQQKKNYIGEDLDQAYGITEKKYPVKRGIIEDFDTMEKIWEWSLDKIEFQCDNGVLLTEPLMNSIKNKEKQFELFFDTFLASKVFIAAQPLLSLYSTGKLTGLVIGNFY